MEGIFGVGLISPAVLFLVFGTAAYAQMKSSPGRLEDYREAAK